MIQLIFEEVLVFETYFTGSYWDSEDQVFDKLFKAMDTSGDSKIDLSEFLYLINLLFGKDKELFEMLFRIANLSHTAKLSISNSRTCVNR
jgi:Ca2+-binding EF-hand superfamily protein